MNTKRVVGWVAFFGVAAALTWFPDDWMPSEEVEVSVATASTSSTGKARGALPTASAAKNRRWSRT